MILVEGFRSSVTATVNRTQRELQTLLRQVLENFTDDPSLGGPTSTTRKISRLWRRSPRLGKSFNEDVVTHCVDVCLVEGGSREGYLR